MKSFGETKAGKHQTYYKQPVRVLRSHLWRARSTFPDPPPPSPMSLLSSPHLILLNFLPDVIALYMQRCFPSWIRGFDINPKPVINSSPGINITRRLRWHPLTSSAGILWRSHNFLVFFPSTVLFYLFFLLFPLMTRDVMKQSKGPNCFIITRSFHLNNLGLCRHG